MNKWGVVAHIALTRVETIFGECWGNITEYNRFFIDHEEANFDLGEDARMGECVGNGVKRISCVL